VNEASPPFSLRKRKVLNLSLRPNTADKEIKRQAVSHIPQALVSWNKMKAKPVLPVNISEDAT
jgi:hypothetical protein